MDDKLFQKWLKKNKHRLALMHKAFDDVIREKKEAEYRAYILREYKILQDAERSLRLHHKKKGKQF